MNSSTNEVPEFCSPTRQQRACAVPIQMLPTTSTASTAQVSDRSGNTAVPLTYSGKEVTIDASVSVFGAQASEILCIYPVIYSQLTTRTSQTLTAYGLNLDDILQHFINYNVRGYPITKEILPRNSKEFESPFISAINEIANKTGAHPTEEAKDLAIRLLPKISEIALNHGYRYDTHITVSEDGEVVCEWWHNEKKLTIYFNGKTSEYIKVWGADIDTEMESGDIDKPNDPSLFNWLMS